MQVTSVRIEDRSNGDVVVVVAIIPGKELAIHDRK